MLIINWQDKIYFLYHYLYPYSSYYNYHYCFYYFIIIIIITVFFVFIIVIIVIVLSITNVICFISSHFISYCSCYYDFCLCVACDVYVSSRNFFPLFLLMIYILYSHCLYNHFIFFNTTSHWGRIQQMNSSDMVYPYPLFTLGKP